MAWRLLEEIMAKAKETNTASPFKSAYKMLNNRLTHICKWALAGLVAAEIVVGIISLCTGELVDYLDFLEYCKNFLVRPLLAIGVAEAIIGVIKRILERKSNRAMDIKRVHALQILSLGQLLVILVIVPYTHYVFPICYIMPIFAIIISIIYADSHVMTVNAVHTIVGMATMFVLNILRNRSGVIGALPQNYYYQIALALLAAIIVYMMCKSLYEVEEYKEYEKSVADEQIVRARLESDIDPKTGIWNSRRVQRELDKSYDDVTIAMIDIDNFKSVNDKYGHKFGDIVLKRLAEILLSIDSSTNTIARFGGEEFVIIFSGKVSEKYVMEEMNRLREMFMMQEYRETEGMSEAFTFSCGIANSECCNTKDANDILGRADAALYTVKKTMKNRVLFGSKENIRKEYDTFVERIMTLEKSNVDTKEMREKLDELKVILRDVGIE